MHHQLENGSCFTLTLLVEHWKLDDGGGQKRSCGEATE